RITPETKIAPHSGRELLWDCAFVNRGQRQAQIQAFEHEEVFGACKSALCNLRLAIRVRALAEACRFAGHTDRRAWLMRDLAVQMRSIRTEGRATEGHLRLCNVLW